MRSSPIAAKSQLRTFGSVELFLSGRSSYFNAGCHTNCRRGLRNSHHDKTEPSLGSSAAAFFVTVGTLGSDETGRELGKSISRTDCELKRLPA
jgi:hypothetical protein